MAVKLTPAEPTHFDAADILNTEEDIAGFVEVAEEEGNDPAQTEAIVKRAREKHGL